MSDQTALTPEEWAEVFTTEWGRNVHLNRSEHAGAAVCLWGKNFGFAWADVELLEYIASGSLDPETDPLHDLAGRIADLLPPRDL